MCQYRHHRDLVKEKGGNTTHLYKEEWYTATSHSKNVPLNSRKKISLTVLSIALVPGDHSTLDLISSSAWPSDLPSKIQELFLKAEVPSLVLEVFCFFVDVECIFYHQKNMEGGGGFRYCCWWFYCVFVDLFQAQKRGRFDDAIFRNRCCWAEKQENLPIVINLTAFQRQCSAFFEKWQKSLII